MRLHCSQVASIIAVKVHLAGRPKVERVQNSVPHGVWGITAHPFH
jgi:hypothetical protein